ncbi:ammonium transporter [Persephonella hydrogeniphila]|uniref:Ammonium transporter n=1 Tax=Persephonella hydrogeniphila TaxID=198703 RepID=A0A285NCC5_9AQUI|nr:ammonium transporter [Persephonella hydrogeniphila]SNZ07100.1 ammonium transporter [Persephonella hydrogeniphila]
MKTKLAGLLSVLLPAFAFAEEAKIDTGDTAWMITATAFVVLMSVGGLTLFYGGMTRSKNIVNTVMMVLGAYAVAIIVWTLWGYSIAFSDGEGALYAIAGDLRWFLLNGIPYTQVSGVGAFPEWVFIAFQSTFAAITVALASGAVIERMKFSTWMVFAILWVTFVYAPIAHVVWGGGFLFDAGALDFAGGTVVHINAGVTGLVLALLLGKRKDYKKTAILPSSVVLTSLGAGLLWFGWFGFNAGSAFGANEVAGVALLTTNIATAAGVLSWIIMEWITAKKPTLLGAASGAIAGLVAITPAAGFVSPSGAIIIGLVAGVVGWFGVFVLKKALGYDDSLDAFGIHGLAGIWGAIATGFFALQSLAWDGSPLQNGDRMGQILVQIESVIFTIVFTAVMTAILYFVSSIITGGARVDDETETMGLDEATHGERGFNL